MHSNELLWESNFSSHSELEKHWNIEVCGPRHVNNELQQYTNDSVQCHDNELVLSMTKNGHDIKSGRINSKGKIEIQYGYIEGYMKFTGSVKGLWPAFWLLGNNLKWPNCGEIDIMEYVSWNPNAVYGTLHGTGYSGGNAYGSGGCNKLNKPLHDEYHKYAIEWKPNIIKWYIDDQLFFTATRDELHHKKGNCHWIYNDRPFYLILNFAVGGEFGGAFHDSEKYIFNNLNEHNEFNIKYIKVYKTVDGHGTVTVKN
jgi:beta-glucanase (GH16 family)